MAKNEHGDEYPDKLLELVTEIVTQEKGLRLIPNYKKYVYLDGRYGKRKSKAYFQRESMGLKPRYKYSYDFPACITGNKATRFEKTKSYEANKVEITYLGENYAVFLSPSFGGFFIDDPWANRTNRKSLSDNV